MNLVLNHSSNQIGVLNVIGFRWFKNSHTTVREVGKYPRSANFFCIYIHEIYFHRRMKSSSIISKVLFLILIEKFKNSIQQTVSLEKQLFIKTNYMFFMYFVKK